MAAHFDVMKRVGAELNLRIDPPEPRLLGPGYTLTGEVGGVRVQVSYWVAQFAHLEYAAFFERPAGLGLGIHTAGLVAKLKELFGKHDIRLGDAEFDAAFEVKGNDPARVTALLGAPLRKLLLEWKRTDADFAVTDEGVLLSTIPGMMITGAMSAPETIVQNTRAVASLVGQLGAALQKA